MIHAPLRILDPMRPEPMPKRAEPASTSAKLSAITKLEKPVTDYLDAVLSEWLARDAKSAREQFVESHGSRPILVGIPKAARLIDLSEETIARLIRTGKVPSVRVGTRVLLRVRDLETWADELPYDLPEGAACPSN